MKLRDSGDYRCKVKNEYGVLEQRVALTVTPSDESMGSGAIRLYIEGITCNKWVSLLIGLITDFLTLFELFFDQVWTIFRILYKISEFLFTAVEVFSNII